MSTLAVAPPEAAAQPRLTTLSAKFLVALTGLGLIGFLFVHMAGNFLLFAGQGAFNDYAKKLEDLGPLLWVARGGLLVIFLLHVVLAIGLQRRNKAARPIGYLRTRRLTSSPASRTMLLTGILLLLFILFHLAHYTFGFVHDVPKMEYTSGQAKVVLTVADQSPKMVHIHDLKDKQGRRDAYAMAIYGFRSPLITTLYVLSMLVLMLHLYHGGTSIFQSLGINHPRYNPVLARIGLCIAALIGLGNISMPLAVLFGFIGGDIPKI